MIIRHCTVNTRNDDDDDAMRLRPAFIMGFGRTDGHMNRLINPPTSTTYHTVTPTKSIFSVILRIGVNGRTNGRTDGHTHTHMTSYHESKQSDSPVPLDAPLVDRPGVHLENADAAALKKALPFSPDRRLPDPRAAPRLHTKAEPPGGMKVRGGVMCGRAGRGGGEGGGADGACCQC